MSFVQKENQENNYNEYKELVRLSNSIVSQLNAWDGKHATLKSKVDTEKQGELDSKKTEFISAIKSVIGS